MSLLHYQFQPLLPSPPLLILIRERNPVLVVIYMSCVKYVRYVDVSGDNDLKFNLYPTSYKFLLELTLQLTLTSSKTIEERVSYRL